MQRAVLAAATGALVVLSGCAVPGLSKGDTTGPGQRAGDYLHAQPYTSLIVEVDYVNGSAPEDQAMQTLTQRLQDAAGKGPQIVETGGVAGQGTSHKYTMDEIAALEAKYRQKFTGGTQAVLFILYLDGGSSDDTSNGQVLGEAYRGSSVAMFKGNIRSSSCTQNCLNLPGGVGNTKPPIAAVEESVITHETGHILGLVDNGIAMQTPHEDPQHPKHSNNQQSVMYWAVESSAIGSFFGQTPPNDYDSNDKADLQAARAG